MLKKAFLSVYVSKFSGRRGHALRPPYRLLPLALLPIRLLFQYSLLLKNLLKALSNGRVTTVITFKLVYDVLCLLEANYLGGTPTWNRQGCLSEILNLKETIWAWLKLFVTPKGDQYGCGLSKF